MLPRASIIPDIVTAGGSTVGIRWPSHPFTQAVIRACDFPLAAPSANRSGFISPTRPAHVLASLDGRIDLVLDAGPTASGLESTIVAVRPDGSLEQLRPGPIELADAARAGLIQNHPADALAGHPGWGSRERRWLAKYHPLTAVANAPDGIFDLLVSSAPAKARPPRDPAPKAKKTTRQETRSNAVGRRKTQ